MRKFRWITAVIILSLVFSACSNLENNEGPTSGEGGENFPEVIELVPTSTVPADSSGADQTPQAAEADPTQQAEGVGEVPPDNLLPSEDLNTAMLVNSLLTYHVGNQDGRFGLVSGIALDALSGQVEYLAVTSMGPAPSQDYLLPWGAFQIVALPADQPLEGAVPAPAVYITLDEETLENAPQFDPTVFGGEVDPNWDAELREYWASHLPEMPVTGERDPSASSTQWISGSMFGGVEFDVQNSDGENLGEIEDFILSPDGTITFGLLEADTFLNLRNQWIVIPWSVLNWIPEEQHFLLNAPNGALENAPRFDPNQLPDMSVPGWDAPWNEYWQNIQQEQSQAEPSITTDTPGAFSPMFASTLQDHPIEGQNGEVGSISDWWLGPLGNSDFMLVDVQDGQVLVPWQALLWQPEEDQMGLNVAQEVIENAPVYDGAEADAEARTWHARADEYWNQYIALPEPVPSNAPEQEQPWALVSTLLGTEVQDVAGESLGSVGDFVVNPDGSVRYVAIENNGQLRPVPWANFTLDPEQETLTFIDDTERFQDAPGFDDVEEVNLSNEDWDSEYRTYWGIE